MIFIIEFDKEKLIGFLESKTRELIRFLYSWITNDGEILGYILGVLHFIFSIVISVIVVISHTIYPKLWFQGFGLLCLFLVWFQHVILKVCISIVAEERLTNGRAPFFGIVNGISSLFKIPFDRFVENILLAETIAVASFTLAFIGRISSILHKSYLS
jgi:uncharacterized membrane protein YagU involved in acid resistance